VAKSNVRKQITDAKLALKPLMRESLAAIAENMIDQIMAGLARATPSERLNAIKDISPTGQAVYRQALLAAFAVVASDALINARKQVPKAKKVKLTEIEGSLQLGDFENLPPAIRKKLLTQQTLTVDTQIADLQKAIFFQFNHSVDSTDSDEVVRTDLETAADDYVTGAAIEAGAGTLAAQIVNEARNEFFFDPDVLDEIDAFEFTNGDPVSEICTDLDGTVFDKDDPNRFRYTPPLHFNCKSSIEPILKGGLKGRSIEPLKPSTQKIEDTIQFAETVCCGGEFHVHDVDPVS
jgi:hypothetical protein